MPPSNGSLPIHPLPSLQQRGLTGNWLPFVDDHLLTPERVFGVALKAEDVSTAGVLEPSIWHGPIHEEARQTETRRAGSKLDQNPFQSQP
jgi:hypothetical protein